MFTKIKNRIEHELEYFVQKIDKIHSLSLLSPVLFACIKNFILRPGKRIRPLLFVAGYLGFTEKSVPGLYTSALSMELFHDFMLIHDDIIDKSDTRRGKPSMHKMFRDHFRQFKNAKFSGEDLSIITGDIIYAIAIDAFGSIKESSERKEKALTRFIRAAVYTGIGEFIELVNSTTPLDATTRESIHKVYDYKTAYYTFSCPLSTGAILAGASPRQVNILDKYGMHLGRAFQINDDILGIFGDEAKTGKSSLTDLQEAKKTILIWYAYNNTPKKDQTVMSRLFTKEHIAQKDLSIMREILSSSGALDFARGEIAKLSTSANRLLKASKIKPIYKKEIKNFTEKFLTA